MKRLINLRLMLLSAVAIVLTSVLCTLAYYRVFREEVLDDLETLTRVLADGDYLSDNTLLAAYADELASNNIRLTLVRENGSVAFDNVARADALDNHGDRAEIEEAFAAGEGYSIRRSATINNANFYYAVRLPDGGVLRTARESSSLFGVFAHAIPVVILLCLLLFVACTVISRFMAGSILRPIRAMAYRLDHPEEQEAEGYPELSPILAHIRRQHEDIVAAARLRQEFTANVSHELKTPLTAVSGYAELIENGMAGEENTRKFAGEIHRSADRLLTLINDILRLSELDAADNARYERETVDLHAIAVTCAAMLEPACEKHGVAMEVLGEKTEVYAVKDMMEELVFNLCDNAIRYNRPGGTVWITTRDHALTVRDNGIGIAKEHQGRIFERFFRVDKSRSKKTGGTGLGLAIVKHIVELHGAALLVESEEGEGTAISVRF